jgi:hypothetical protein
MINTIQHHLPKAALVFVLAAIILLIPGQASPSQAQIGGTISYGNAVFGVISATTPALTYSFDGNAGDLVSVDVRGLTGDLDPVVTLADAAQQVLKTNNNHLFVHTTNDVRFAAYLPQTGPYAITVSGANGTGGDFLLRLDGRPPTIPTPLVYGVPVTVDIPANATPQYYRFDTENCPTTLTVSNPSAGQPYSFPFVVRVRDQQGTEVTLLRGGEMVEDRVTVEALSGWYEVDVLSDDPQATGAITLLVSCGDGAPGCAGGQDGGAAADECPPCPNCGGDPPGTIDVTDNRCIDTAFDVSLIEPATSTIDYTWNAIPGADTYRLTFYALMSDGSEFAYGWVEVDTNDYPARNFDFLPPEFAGFRIVLEVFEDGEVICTDQDIVYFQRGLRTCPDLGLEAILTNPDTRSVSLRWDPTLGADRFDIALYSITPFGESFSGMIPVDGMFSEYVFDHFPPELNGIRAVLWMERGDLVCSAEVMVDFSSQPQQAEPAEPRVPCIIRGEGIIWVHVGPGRNRGVFDYLPTGQDIAVIGQALDDDGNLWWQIDPTVIPGGTSVASLWVMASDVVASGDCDEVPQGEIPPIVPDDDPGEWLPCGSCDTCGHPANECVTSPTGECLWDPATCVQQIPGGDDDVPPGDDEPQQPPDDDDGPTPPPPPCYSLSVGTSAGGSVSYITPQNCQGGYTPGSLVIIQVAPDTDYAVQYWSGDCDDLTTPAYDQVTNAVTMNSSCSVFVQFYTMY